MKKSLFEKLNQFFLSDVKKSLGLFWQQDDIFFVCLEKMNDGKIAIQSSGKIDFEQLNQNQFDDEYKQQAVLCLPQKSCFVYDVQKISTETLDKDEQEKNWQWNFQSSLPFENPFVIQQKNGWLAVDGDQILQQKNLLEAMSIKLRVVLVAPHFFYENPTDQFFPTIQFEENEFTVTHLGQSLTLAVSSKDEQIFDAPEIFFALYASAAWLTKASVFPENFLPKEYQSVELNPSLLLKWIVLPACVFCLIWFIFLTVCEKNLESDLANYQQELAMKTIHVQDDLQGGAPDDVSQKNREWRLFQRVLETEKIGLISQIWLAFELALQDEKNIFIERIEMPDETNYFVLGKARNSDQVNDIVQKLREKFLSELPIEISLENFSDETKEFSVRIKFFLAKENTQK